MALAALVFVAQLGEPLAAHAQTVEPAPPSAAEPQRRWVMPAPEAEAEREAPAPIDDVDLAGNVWAEIGGGVLGVLVGGAALVGGVFLAVNSGDGTCGGACVPLLVAGSIGVFVGPALGVTLAGDATGGQGNFGAALLGTLPGVLLSLPGLVIGAVAGYRISAPDKPAPRAAGASVLLIDLRF
ncbi:MAG TPA: hypothetical protein VJR89_26555 [Polyangiales bacterium]|nr:hypothetical protein [Polyangiales bacterium]